MAKKIINLTAITAQSATDLYETSLNGAGSRKETRAQMSAYFNNFYVEKTVTLTEDYLLTADDNNTLFIVGASAAVPVLNITIPSGLSDGFRFGVKNMDPDAFVQVQVLYPSGDIDIFANNSGVGVSRVAWGSAATYVVTASWGVISRDARGFSLSPYIIQPSNGASYTLRPGDNGNLITLPSATALTLPANADVPLQKGFWCKVYNSNTSAIAISSASVIEGTSSIPAGAVATLVKVQYSMAGTETWLVTVAVPYEEFNATANTWSGPYAAPVSAAYKAIRIGKQVFLTLDGFEGAPTIPNFATASIALPSSFRPIQQAFAIVAVFDNSVTAPGWVSVFNDGVIVIGVGNYSAGFTDSGDGGLLGTTGMTWAV